jgi:hypothetical protein
MTFISLLRAARFCFAEDVAGRDDGTIKKVLMVSLFRFA